MKYISISGAVAAGKTTMLDRLLSHYGDRAKAREERPQDNPFIREYYAESARWSFHSQMTFLALYFDRPDWKLRDRDFYFFDRCLIENLVIARYRLEAGDLTEDEYHVIDMMAHGIHDLMPAIDKYIYLKCSVPTLLRHARERGRDYEADIYEDYYTLQKKLYDEWASRLPPGKTLVVDMDGEPDFDEILRFIEAD